MRKTLHEIRDPIHNFVRVEDAERQVLNSRPFQRLRHIHQLGMSHFIYPGANHTRFEHSLGVMELATRVFDLVTRSDLLTDSLRDTLPELRDVDELDYWRRVLRMAALCHDLGHLPFSHAAEKELLPDGWDHEQLTRAIIESPEMCEIWDGFTPKLEGNHIAKLAVGPAKYGDVRPTTWESILSEIITGDAFGVDRMDYLLRDAHHLGVAYGKFDHYRLIDTLRLAIPPQYAGEEDASGEPTLGIEEGGLHSAEGLLLARYFMFAQVYFHHVRRVYDIHLKEFLQSWLPEGRFPTEVSELLAITDHEVMGAMLAVGEDEADPGHTHGRRILCREHFRRVYSPTAADKGQDVEARSLVFQAIVDEFESENVRGDHVPPKRGRLDFPVVTDEDDVVPAISVSDVVSQLPHAGADYVFVHPDLCEKARAWLEANKEHILGAEEDANP